MSETAAVITISDKGAKGEREDTSGPAICEMLKEAGYEIIYRCVVPDERTYIEEELVRSADELDASLVITTGGTGFALRDVTPEATKAVIDRECPGIAEYMRYKSMEITDRACLSRGVCGIRGETLIVNLPGSEKAARENLSFILSPLGHGIEMMHTQGSAECGQ